jgi:hypothetical protein
MRDTYETPFDRDETPFDGDRETRRIDAALDRIDTRLADMAARLDRIEASLDRLNARLDRLISTMRRLFILLFLGLTVELGLSDGRPRRLRRLIYSIWRMPGGVRRTGSRCWPRRRCWLHCKRTAPASTQDP